MSTVKTARLEDLQTEEARLQKLIEERTKRVMALTEDAESVRKDVAASYRKKFETRFKDLDIIQALAGFPAAHTVTVFGVGYVLTPPSQGTVHAAEKFAANPVFEQNNFGPLRAEELTLMGWLTAVRADSGQETKLTDKAYHERLTGIRRLPEVLLSRLAEECVNIQTYLNVCLEAELGNS